MALRDWLQLSLTKGLGPILIGRIVERAGSAEAAVSIPMRELQQIEGIGLGKAAAIHEAMKRAAEDAEAQMKAAERIGAKLIGREDEKYPPLLRNIPDPPVVLYMKGDLEPRDLQSIAIVGSRGCSQYGAEQANRFGALLAGVGMTIVSGGARGIDSAAHRGALQHPAGRTIAVLGCGVDIVYPPENGRLFEEIAGRGAVMSEYPIGTPPNSENFPRRNRIVSGMSRGVLVIEAREISGALITARCANEDQGRPVFALPGRVDNPMSAGPHQLIRDGAILAANIEDILEGLHPLPQDVQEPMLFDVSAVEEMEKQPTRVGPVSLTPRQAMLLEKMGRETSTVDQIVERANLEAGVVLQELTFLSLKGMVKRVDGQSYVRLR